MGLQQALGYQPGDDRRLRSAVVRVTGTRLGAWLVSKVLTPIDRAIYRFTKGRHTLTAFVTGLPVVMLVTVGARTGKERSSPLIGIPVGEDLAVIASNFGQQRSPAWVHNLLAHPRAWVTFGQATAEVTARLVETTEYEHVFDLGTKIIPSFRYYRHRVTDREIPIFMLSPVG